MYSFNHKSHIHLSSLTLSRDMKQFLKELRSLNYYKKKLKIHIDEETKNNFNNRGMTIIFPMITRIV